MMMLHKAVIAASCGCVIVTNKVYHLGLLLRFYGVSSENNRKERSSSKKYVDCRKNHRKQRSFCAST